MCLTVAVTPSQQCIYIYIWYYVHTNSFSAWQRPLYIFEVRLLWEVWRLHCKHSGLRPGGHDHLSVARRCQFGSRGCTVARFSISEPIFTSQMTTQFVKKMGVTKPSSHPKNLEVVSSLLGCKCRRFANVLVSGLNIVAGNGQMSRRTRFILAVSLGALVLNIGIIQLRGRSWHPKRSQNTIYTFFVYLFWYVFRLNHNPKNILSTACGNEHNKRLVSQALESEFQQFQAGLKVEADPVESRLGDNFAGICNIISITPLYISITVTFFKTAFELKGVLFYVCKKQCLFHHDF